MIRAVEDKNCVNDLVKLELGKADSELIITANEIKLLKIGDKKLINKYYSDFLSSNNLGLFKYNEMYLDFKNVNDNFYLHSHYFVTENDCTMNFIDDLSTSDNLLERKISVLNRDEIENLFDSNNYDSMYVIDRNGNVLYANNKIDGCIIDKKLIPTDNEIIDIVLKKEKEHRILSKIEGLEKIKENNITPDINKIKNVKIYGSSMWPFSGYSNILILSKDGKFDIKWFDLYFVEKDKFKITTSDINISNPDIKMIYEYLDKYGIRYIPEPLVFDCDSFSYDEDKYPILIKK